jgi:asparagine synthase (glutamine-hydrolysing)
MCGIAGYIGPESRQRQHGLGRALCALQHRGPDDSGTAFFQSEGAEVGLGSRRLSILDLSPAGHMPMLTADGACAIVFNGEIYDAPSHRKDLQGRGVAFHSRSDTEVLLYGLALDGPEFLNRIDGMYAFAFWDGREGALLLARDRFGEKPLFAMEVAHGGLLFASEIPALIQLAGFTPEVDRDALRHFVEWGYPPVERSLFSGIYKVQPGTWEWHGKRPRSGVLAPLMPNREIERARNVKAAGALVRDALRESVRDRLVADVPVGVFLSGGIDSAGIAALAVNLMPKSQKLNTYTVGYPGAATSELVQARRIADRLGTCHHEIIPDDEHLAALPFLCAAMGEPVGDPAALPTYFLSITAGQTSTVLLTGEGADEVFFGYPRYLLHDIAGNSAKRGFLRGVVSRAQASFIPRLQNIPESPEERDYLWKGLSPERWGLFQDGDGGTNHAQAGPRNGESAARWSRRDDMRRWLPENVLARVDRMTMAASIEARAPYLGREVARLGFHLPDRTLRGFPFGKLALRSALAPYLPWWKCWKIKRPFAVPLRDWLCGPLRSLVDDVFFGERLVSRGWFKRAGLRAVGAAVLRGEQQAMRLAWALLTLELWARAHLDGEIPMRPAPAGTGRSAQRLATSNRSPGRQLVLAIDFPPAIGGIQRYSEEIWGHGGLGDVCVVAPRSSGSMPFDRTFPGRVVRLPWWPGRLGNLAYAAAMAAEMPRLLRKDSVIQVAHVALAPAVLPHHCCPVKSRTESTGCRVE